MKYYQTNTIDSGPAVAHTFHYGPVVLDEDDNNTVYKLDEYNNNKHVRKIVNENKKPRRTPNLK